MWPVAMPTWQNHRRWKLYWGIGFRLRGSDVFVGFYVAMKPLRPKG